MRYLIDTPVSINNDWFIKAIYKEFGEQASGTTVSQLNDEELNLTYFTGDGDDDYECSHSLIQIFDDYMRGISTEEDRKTRGKHALGRL